MNIEFPEIEFDDRGFRLIQEGQVLHEVSWPDVEEIYAFKLDLLTVDEICLGFRIDEPSRSIEVSEEWPGYQAFVQSVQERFLLKIDWWCEVAFPAFETNYTTIWKRPATNEV